MNRSLDSAAAVILTLTGGIVTTWENGPAQGGGRIIVAGDKRVHQAALEVLAGQ
jgi:myo-inositol-1(or 4)-monophosphatase